MKHTPGPWKVGERDENDNTLGIVEDGGYPSEIARICPRAHYHNDQIANARLIASAPKLLEGLKQVYESIEGDESMRFRFTAEYILTLIAKAEGKE